MAKKNTAAVAEELAQPILDEMGLLLWDVVYEKEGSGWYLRYYVDKEGGIDINSCEAFSRAVEKALDAADPIEGSYTLEVSSPGIERQLTRDWHFEALMESSFWCGSFVRWRACGTSSAPCPPIPMAC